MTELKPWVRVVVTIYVALLVPVLLFMLVIMVLHAPRTRPDRYTILEHLDLDAAAIRAKVDAYVEAYG